VPDAQAKGGGQNIGWSVSATQSAAGELLDGVLGIDPVDLYDNTYGAGYKEAAGVGAGVAGYYSPSSKTITVDLSLYAGIVGKLSVTYNPTDGFEIKSGSLGIGFAFGVKGTIPGAAVGVFGDALAGGAYKEGTAHFGVSARGNLAGGVGEINGEAKFGLGFFGNGDFQIRIDSPLHPANKLSPLDQIVEMARLNEFDPRNTSMDRVGGYNFADPAGGHGPSYDPSRPGPGPAPTPMDLSTGTMSTPHSGGYSVTGGTHECQ